VTSVTGDAQTGYWYPDAITGDRTVAVLNAMRAYRTAEQDMRARTRSSMGMGEKDMAALRLVMAGMREGRDISPGDIAHHLGITSASATLLVDRLEKSGHLRRDRHPVDRRKVIVVATDSSDDEVRHTLGEMHVRMRRVVESMPEEDARVVIGFLTRMRDAVTSG
jgi:DNA-binding MarR family transcriptional regulator